MTNNNQNLNELELCVLKDILMYFKSDINKLLNNTPLNEFVPHESYLYFFEIYHIPESIISTIALNYIYWFNDIEEHKKNHIQNNPNNIPINFFNVDNDILDKYKEEIFYAIAYIAIICEKFDMLCELSSKLDQFDFFKNSENYFLIKCYGDEKDANYNNYINVSKKYLCDDCNNLFLKQFAFRLNVPEKTKDNFKEICEYYANRYDIFKDAISVCNVFSTIQNFVKNIDYAIELFDGFKNVFDKNDANSEYFKSFYVNEILLQLTTYYTVAKKTKKLKETIKIINDLGYKYKNIKTGRQIFLVKGIDEGKNAWYYVLVDPNLNEKFMKELNDDMIDLEQIGIVLYSAFGENPPDDITKNLKIEYNIISEPNEEQDLTEKYLLSKKNNKLLYLSKTNKKAIPKVLTI